MVMLHNPVRVEDLSRMLLGEPAPTCAMCISDEHEDCLSADEIGAVDLCGCACHLW